MLKIRLSRIGKKHSPHYRIVVIPARTKREGKALEYIGYYNPRSKEVKLDTERAKYWLSQGAKPTDTVVGILVKHKLAKPQPRVERPPKKPKKELKKKQAEKKEKPKKPKIKQKEAKEKKEGKKVVKKAVKSEENKKKSK